MWGGLSSIEMLPGNVSCLVAVSQVCFIPGRKQGGQQLSTCAAHDKI